MWDSSNSSLVRPSITTAPAATASSTSCGVSGAGVPKSLDQRPAVEVDDPLDVGRLVAERGDRVLDELGLVVDPEGAVVAALEADRRGGLEVDRGAAAERAAEVGGPDLDLVVEREQPLVQGAEHLGGALARLHRQVGAGDVADEQRVAAEQRPGSAAAAGVAQQEGGVLGPVPGRVDRLDREVAQLQHPAVGERLVRRTRPRPARGRGSSPRSSAPAARARRRGRRGCGSPARARSAPRAAAPGAGRARRPTADRRRRRRPLSRSATR